MKTISKRWIKNAVAIVVMLALCGSMVFTMSYAKSHAQASDMPQGAPDQGSDLSTLYYILFGAECFLLVSVKPQHIASQCEI